MSECREEQESYWPAISLESTPRRLYHFHNQFQSQLPSNNFFKAVKWAPDGSCFVTCSEDKSLRIFDLPADAVEARPREGSQDDSYHAALQVQEGETVYDFCWYPGMSATDPASCLLATTTRDHPVHLWDAVSGNLRCTYRAYDAMDEIAAAYSVAFHPLGSKVYCGYNKAIRVFDAARPGRDCALHSTLTKAKDGQNGIISCLAFSPNSSGMLAAGSYNRTTGLYAADDAELLVVLHGQEGGVTQLLFSSDGNFLFTGGRKDPYILCWDVRHTSGVVYKLPRVTALTNQRVAFDVEPWGRYLGSGGQDGYVHLYDLQTGGWVSSFQAALDTINGFSFHPSLPLAASCSGQRRFTVAEDEAADKLTARENCASVWQFDWTWQLRHPAEVGLAQVEGDEEPVMKSEQNGLPPKVEGDEEPVMKSEQHGLPPKVAGDEEPVMKSEQDDLPQEMNG